MSKVDFEAEQAPPHATGLANISQPEHMRCYSCMVKEQKEYQQSCCKLKHDVLQIFGEDYHLHDFVYLKMRPSRQKDNGLLTIAQIVDLLPSSGDSDLRVAVLQRATETSDEETPQMQVRGFASFDYCPLFNCLIICCSDLCYILGGSKGSLLSV